MNRIKVGAELKSRMLNFAEPFEVCDEDGFVIGRFIPGVDPSQIEPNEPPISEEELQRRERSNRWYSTEEVLAHLRSLENQ
jgi:hypothetical protein